jgi:exopolyphosphatase/guanosine-5'-triphosphate,3'-diphosphate pyrophosphatase
LKSSGLIVSAYGLREGLLHQSLPDEVRVQDPLICAAREEGVRQGRFPEHGDLLDRWIAPLFIDEDSEDRRLRHAACLLADVGWRAHPEFRAERGLDTALHGNWVGIDARGRAMIGRALFTSFGGRGEVEIINRLCSAEESARADRWGLAMRLGQRLSGGVAEALGASRMSLEPDAVVLHLDSEDEALYGESVDRRLRALAAAFGRRAVVES